MKYKSVVKKLFPENYQLIDSSGEIFELELAYWEYKSLQAKDLIKRGAYFKLVNGKSTNHYLTCNYQNLEEIHKNSSLRTKVFFLTGKYSTGYATHSLFPYRGKFHPQMIRALLNVIGVKPGDIVLDPMSGSATLSVEANLININSIGVDISPFCCLMGRVKTFSLNLNPSKLEKITKNISKIFNKLNKPEVPGYFLKNTKDENKLYYEIILLAFLDAMGFARRSYKPLESLFPRVLERYVLTINNFQKAREKLGLKIGKTQIIQKSASALPLEDNCIDGVITSPPYSFAIDYIENDRPQLEYLRCDPTKLKEEMIGLQGRGIEQKLQLYFDKLDQVLKEISRVTKKNSRVIFIIGTNDIQTRGVRLENRLKMLAEENNLKFETEILKPIKGLNNTMQEEYILFFKNVK